MKTYKAPHSDSEVSSVVLGLMRIAQMDNSEIRALFDTAREAGITVFDHADIYGGARHRCEERFGEAVTLTPSERESIVIQSKVGIRQGWFDFSRDHILKTVDESLAALKTDYLDVLLLHRPDALVEPEEVAKAFDLLAFYGVPKRHTFYIGKDGKILFIDRNINAATSAEDMAARLIDLGIPARQSI